MLSARKEERNRAAFLGGNNAACKDARASRLVSLLVDITTEAQDRMDVSSLCNTSLCAACRINSSKTGAIRTAIMDTISHCMDAGKGSPGSVRVVPADAGGIRWNDSNRAWEIGRAH